MNEKLKTVKSTSLHLPGYFLSKKSPDLLAPIFEAISNSWEAFPDSQKERNIVVDIHFDDSDIVSHVVIKDNGVGFNEENYERFLKFNDNRKGPRNKGTGRVQFLEFFDSYEILSTFEEKGKHYTRFLFSSQELIKENILCKESEPFESKDCIGTSITFNTFLSDKDKEAFSNLSLDDIKDRILQHFLWKAATTVNPPEILIETSHGTRRVIDAGSYPAPTRKEFLVPVFDENAQSAGTTELHLAVFKFPKGFNEHHHLFVSSKGEYVKDLNLSCIKDKNSPLNGVYYVAAVSGDCLDKFVNDGRNDINLPDRDNLNFPALSEIPFFYYEDLETNANQAFLDCCPEIQTFIDEHKKQVRKITEALGIPETIVKDADLKTCDSDETIIKKCYKVEAECNARNDVKVLDLTDRINSLNPNSDEYQRNLEKLADELNGAVSMQNKEQLSRYISRRRIVLDLLETILNNNLNVQNTTKRKETEALLHNVIFEKGTNNPLLSDLWILDEAAIYFNGVSDQKLENVKYDGKPLFDANIKGDDFYWENNQTRRPDILLFPSEGKCIIIEFKAPDVPIEKYLGQGSRYAALINTYSREDVVFKQFYIYLIGEGYSYRDVVSADVAYTQLPSSSILFKNAPVADLNNPENRKASGYYEVLNYSSLIERAKTRNKIFFDKLFNTNSES